MNPQKLKLKKILRDYFTLEDIHLILFHLSKNYEHQVWFKFIYTFGISCKELIEIKIEDINFEFKKIKFKNKNISRECIVPKYLENDLIILKAHKKNHDYLFQKNSKKLKLRTVESVFEKVSFLLGKKINSTILRKSLIFHLLNEGWTKERIFDFFGGHYERMIGDTFRKL